MGQLPTGIVTFLLTDVEGSTRLWQQHEDVMDDVIARHVELISDAVAAHGGSFVKSQGEGDSTFSVFGRPMDAIAAAIEAQHALQSEEWPGEIDLATRVALHTGEARLRDGDYLGTTVNRCARLRSIAHGAQIICSQSTAELAAEHLAPDVSMHDLGPHGLRDLLKPEHVYQLSHPGLRFEFPPLRSMGTVRTNLPAQRTTFVGRGDELIAVRKYLAENRLVTLTGVGGCGKTRLAIEAAAEETDNFDGVYFCDLSSIADPEVVVSEVAKSVGAKGAGPLAPSNRSVLEDLLDHLQDRLVLLVLDNCEHLLDACASLMDHLLDNCSRLKVIATSREALEVDGERAYTVPSLTLPENLGEARESEAVRLFSERAAAVLGSFELDDAVAPHVVEICRRLDGIPLAIELAAAQSSALSPSQIEERLSDRFKLLSGGRRRVQRQQTLAAMLDWSHDLLSESERMLLRRLAVFPQPFTLDQAERIASTGSDEFFSDLRSLIGKSLLVKVDARGGQRYRLLETVRLYAEQKLMDAGEAEELRTRHRDVFLEWILSFDDEVAWGSVATALYMDELDHLRAAMRWSDEEGRLDVIAEVMGRTLLAWPMDLEEVFSWIKRALLATDLSNDSRLRVLVVSTWNALARSDTPTMYARAEEALKLEPDESGVLYSTALAFMSLYWAAATYLFGGEEGAALARDYADRAAARAHSGSARLFSGMWRSIGLVGLRDYEAAKAAITEVISIERERDAWLGCAYTTLAVVEHLRGEFGPSVDAMEQSLEAWATDEWGIQSDMDTLWTAFYGPALAAAGREKEGVRFLKDLTDHMHESGAAPLIMPIVQACIGIVAGLKGDFELGVRLGITQHEAPLTPLEHSVGAMYIARAKETLPPDIFERACAEGRELSFADATAMAFEALDG